jgi:folate-binding protein YgfZ
MTAIDRAKQGALVVLRPERGTITVTGRERKSWLNGLLTCDMGRVEEGRGAFGLALTKQGKILSDLLVVEGAGAVELGVAPGVSESLAATLDRHLVMEDAEIRDRSNDVAWIGLHGPRAVELARALAEERSLAFGAVELAPGGAAALVAPRRELSACAARLVELGRGTAHLADDRDWLAFRLEHGLGAFGVDFGPLDNPHEAALDRRAVSWTKGCYLGQEVVCMQDMRGKVKRRLALLTLDGGGALAPGDAVFDASGTSPAGQVTSALAVEPGLTLALAQLKAPFFEPGTSVLAGGKVARVLAPPGVESEAR